MAKTETAPACVAGAANSTGIRVPQLSHNRATHANKARLTRRQAAASKKRKYAYSRYAAIERSTKSPAAAIALHEAAHAVVATLVCLPWNFATMLPEPKLDWSGFDAAYDERPASAALVVLAGPVADTLTEAFHPDMGEIHPSGNVPDLLAANAWACQVLGVEVPESSGLHSVNVDTERLHAWVTAARFVAAKMLMDHWPLVTALAKELYDHGRIDPRPVPDTWIATESDIVALIDRVAAMNAASPAEELPDGSAHMQRADRYLDQLVSRVPLEQLQVALGGK